MCSRPNTFILAFLAGWVLLVCAGEPARGEEKTAPEVTVTPAQKEDGFFSRIFSTQAYAAKKDKTDNKEYLRQRWKEMLNIDIFYPYFKAKEMEQWIGDRVKVKLFDMEGRPQIKNGQIKYIFKMKF